MDRSTLRAGLDKLAMRARARLLETNFVKEAHDVHVENMYAEEMMQEVYENILTENDE